MEYLVESSEVVLGEMAHVIAQSETGPRGKKGNPGADRYENLILLCPTDHSLVDKASADFPEPVLRIWKREHEDRVAQALASPRFSTKEDLFSFIRRRLTENRTIHRQFGPESAAALNNPLSGGAAYWSLRKLTTIIPNNTRIINAVESNEHLLDEREFAIFVRFREHAAAFERNAYKRMDREIAPRFPPDFAEMVVAD